MTIWVYRGGVMVMKGLERSGLTPVRSSFPTPMISRMQQTYESPIDGKEITSWGQRDRELKEHDCFDPRDMPEGHVYEKSKGRRHE